jgi:Myristoyl-CoA:protein N-myristoyltransferase, C-terminal domain
MTMARTIKLYKLSEETATPGIRPMQQADVPQVLSRWLFIVNCANHSTARNGRLLGSRSGHCMVLQSRDCHQWRDRGAELYRLSYKHGDGMLACLCCMSSASYSMPSALQVKQLLDEYLTQFTLAPVLSEAELAHALLPSDDVVSSYVVAAEGVCCMMSPPGQCAALQCVARVLLCCGCPWSCGRTYGPLPALQQYHVVQCSPVAFADGQLTDLASFYTLPSSVIGHDRHTEMRAAFHYYTVSWRQQDARCTTVLTVWKTDPALRNDMFGCCGLDRLEVSGHHVWLLLRSCVLAAAAILCAGKELIPQTVLPSRCRAVRRCCSC